MSDGLSDYWATQMKAGSYMRYLELESTRQKPVVPRYDDIRVINPEPPYFWLGREAE